MYAAIADAEKKLKREYASIYADDEIGDVNEELVTEDLAAAAAEIDGKVACRYKTPVTAPESLPLLKNWNLVLFAELAYGRSEGAAIPEKVKDAAANVRKQLDAIADGTRKLPGAAAESSSGAGSVALVSSAKPVFTGESMKRW